MDKERRNDDALTALSVFNSSNGDKAHIESLRDSLLKGAGHV
jgi:hypothetical protein